MISHSFRIQTLLSYISFILLIGLIPSCSSEPQPPAYDVRPDFEPHVQKFIEEGQKRGKMIDFSDTGLTIQFREETDSTSSGVCFVGLHHIEIERKDWNGLSLNNKEGLIFHELGHCELGRGHDNHFLSNGEWASRMRGDPITDPNISTVINYSGRRRDYYIDELFDPNTPEPDWVNISQDYEFVNKNDRKELLHILDTVAFKHSFSLVGNANWEIELSMNNMETEEFIVVIWGEDNNERSFRIGYNRDGEFLIISGVEIWGILRQYINFDRIANDIFNKVTIRHVNGVCYVFVNEEFIYWFDYNGQPIGTVQSLERGGVNHFQNVRVSELML